MKPPGLIRRVWAAIVNRYEGAKQSFARGWKSTNLQTARFDITGATREQLVSKAMDFEADNPMFNALLDKLEQYASGFVYEPSSSNPVWNKKAKAWWESDFAKNPAINNRHPLSVNEGLACREFGVKGEAFLAFVKAPSGMFRLQFWEAQQVKTPPVYAKDNGVVDGVRVDVNGRPIYYYVSTRNPNGVESFTEISADSVIHIFEPGRPNQMRGIPPITPSINQLQDLEELSRLEMQCAKQAASVGIVGKNEAGEMDPATFLQNGGTVSTSSDGARSEYYQSVAGPGVTMIKNGDSLEQFRSDRPSVVTMEYWRKLEEAVCAGFGIPRCIVFPDSMQGTVYRGAISTAAAFFDARCKVLIAAFQRVYEYQINWARFNVKGLYDAPDDFKAVKIFHPRSIEVDVGYAASAVVQLLSAGLTSRSYEIGKSGRDWREVFAELAAEQQEAERLNLRLQVGQMPPAQDVAQRQGQPATEEVPA